MFPLSDGEQKTAEIAKRRSQSQRGKSQQNGRKSSNNKRDDSMGALRERYASFFANNAARRKHGQLTAKDTGRKQQGLEQYPISSLACSITPYFALT